MKRGWKILIAGCAVLVVGLAALFASGGPGRLAGASDGEYDLSGMIRLVFSDIDTVCDDPNLAQSGGELLKQMENEILISLIVDSQIVISPEELGEYSCLVLTDPAWVARFGDPGKLRAVELESVSQEMQEFLSAQMPLWTADGSVLLREWACMSTSETACWPSPLWRVSPTMPRRSKTRCSSSSRTRPQ